MSIMGGGLSLGIGVGITSGGRRRFDPDAAAYIAAVEGPSGDNQALEPAVRDAINDFVVGCKSDGIWDAIKACCIMAGARTLAGALRPLKGPAPTNFNFVSADYNRVTGLIGDGATKYLNSNRAGNADPQNSFHLAVEIHTIHSGASTAGLYAGNGGTGTGASGLIRGRTSVDLEYFVRNRCAAASAIGLNPPSAGLFGVSRSVAGQYIARTASSNTTVTQDSQSPAAGSIFVFARESGSGSPEAFANGRLRFYSIGENLNLALLEARLAALMTAIDGALS
jgi:hypothetical protein